MKCKPYSEITVEIRTQLKTVKITSNIFAVHLTFCPHHFHYQESSEKGKRPIETNDKSNDTNNKKRF